MSRKKPTPTNLAEVDSDDELSDSDLEEEEVEEEEEEEKEEQDEEQEIEKDYDIESDEETEQDAPEGSDDENDNGDDGQSSGQSSESESPPEVEKSADKTSKLDKQYDEIRREISTLPFEDLQKLKNKMGLKLFNQIYHGREPRKPQPIPKRANKNRPQELSSKKPPKQRRKAKLKAETRIRDPRFDERAGEFDEQQFKESYAFVDDIKQREKEKLQKMLSKEKNPEKKHKLAYLLNRMNQQEDSKRKKEKTLEVKRKIKKAEREDIVQGQTPFYLKKSDQKKLELAEKFRELKKSGKLEKFMSKKRKKLAQKDRKKMPNV